MTHTEDDKTLDEMEQNLNDLDPNDLHTETKKDDDSSKEDEDDSNADDKADDTNPDDKSDDDKSDDDWEDDDKWDDPNPDKDEEQKKEDKKTWVKKLLSQRNESREEAKALKEELAEANERLEKIKKWELDDDFDDDADKDLALIDAKQDVKLVQRDINKVEKGIDKTRTSELEDFMTANPDLDDLKDDITKFAKENPNLSMDNVSKLVIAETDPTRLLDEQQINKLKWGLKVWGRDNKTTTSKPSIDTMNTDQMEAELESQFG